MHFCGESYRAERLERVKERTVDLRPEMHQEVEGLVAS